MANRVPRSIRTATLSRRRALALGGGLAGAAVLGRGSRAQAPVDLVFTFGPDDSGTLQPLIDAFNAANEGRIRVTWREMARESNDYYRQLKSDFEVGAADADVIGADVIWTAQFAENEWVRDLSSWFHEAYEPRDFVDPAMNSVVYGFEIWGVPWYTDAGLLFYRRDLLEASGFDGPPATWDELRDMAETVTADAGVAHGYVFQGAEYEGGVTNALELIWNAGGRVLTGSVQYAPPPAMPMRDPNVVAVDNPDAARGLDIARGLIEDGIAPEAVTTFREQEAWEAFLAGDAVFMRNWPYVYGVLTDPAQSDLSPEQVGVAPLPVTDAGMRSFSCLGGWNLMIAANSPNPDAAWEFVRFAAAPEQQKARALGGGFLPTLEALYDDPEITEQVPVVALGGEAVRHARMRPQSPLYASISPRIARAFHRVLRGEQSGAEAVSALQSELRTLIRRYG